jgi:A/G-specific adenine glycosylase
MAVRNSSRFTEFILDWYAKNRRSLPWRGQADPYAVWVSEIMLQQTRVEAVIPYFERWMIRFPSITDLAMASEHEVLKFWEGLGYYARARNLRKSAQLVMEQYGGKLPRRADALRKLPGIGRYTAGAIASLAFGMDEPALDGNIRRVLSRVFDVTQPADSPEGQRRLWELAALHLPQGSSADYNQALMDLGSAVCIPLNPRCPICPVRSLCKARKLGIQSQRPVMKTRKVVPHYVFGAAVIVRRSRVLLSQRPSKGLLGGMWEFPNGKIRPNSCKALTQVLRREYNLEIQCGQQLGIVQHGYSHFTVSVHAFRCTAASVPKSKNLRWIPLSQLRSFPMGRIDRQIADRLA